MKGNNETGKTSRQNGVFFVRKVFPSLKCLQKDEQKKSVAIVRIALTCNGVLSADIVVKPTMSLKYIVTQSKLSASTLLPRFNCSATGLGSISYSKASEK